MPHPAVQRCRTRKGGGEPSPYDHSPPNFTYETNSTILSVTDSQSKLLEAHTYDTQGRGLTSNRANKVDSVTLTYP